MVSRLKTVTRGLCEPAGVIDSRRRWWRGWHQGPGQIPATPDPQQYIQVVHLELPSDGVTASSLISHHPNANGCVQNWSTVHLEDKAMASAHELFRQKLLVFGRGIINMTGGV